MGEHFEITALHLAQQRKKKAQFVQSRYSLILFFIATNLAKWNIIIDSMC